MLLMDFGLVALGLFILVGAGDVLVKGAVNLALRLGIPALIVSLTVVAFGTSAPELLVSVSAILDEAPGIALGNVVGSNIANVLLVLGLPALVAGIMTDGHDTRRSYLQMIGASVLFIGACMVGPITWVHGTVLLAGLALMLGDAYRESVRHKRAVAVAAAACAPDDTDPEDVEGADPDMPWWKIGVFLALGLLGLPLGADLLVEGAVNIARTFGVSETVIGLTLVAFGTSLPELAASTAAAFRGHSDVALGNVIGSNIFNLLGIIGVASFVGQIPVAPEFLRLDLWVMLGTSLLLLPFVLWRWSISRMVGAGFIAIYAAYLWVLFH
jgi:cation:H+ antiporter